MLIPQSKFTGLENITHLASAPPSAWTAASVQLKNQSKNDELSSFDITDHPAIG